MPTCLKPVSELIKKVVRFALKIRLNDFRLNTAQAEYWCGKIKKWPGIVSDDDFLVKMKTDNGLIFEVGIIDVIQRSLRTTGHWDPHVYKAISRYLNRGSTFMDVGANIGYFSLNASVLVGNEGKVFAFEPSVRALQRLARHVVINNAANVTVFSLGASRETTMQSLYWANPSNIGASSMVDATLGRAECVPLVKIDDICAAYGIIPDVIKVDVEGAEPDVLEGMKTILSIYKPVIICELNNDLLGKTGRNIGDVTEFMMKLGYGCYVISESDPENEVKLLPDSFLLSGQVDVVFRG